MRPRGKDVTFDPRSAGKAFCSKCKKKIGRGQIETHKIMHSTAQKRIRTKKKKEIVEKKKGLTRVQLHYGLYVRCPKCYTRNTVLPGEVKCRACDYLFIAYE